MKSVRWNRLLAHLKKRVTEQGRDLNDDENLVVVCVEIAIAAGNVTVGAKKGKQLIKRAIAKLADGYPRDEVITWLTDHLRA